MSAPLDEWVMDYVNGTLRPVERAASERSLRDSAALRAEVDEVRELLSGLALGLPPVAPSADLRQRVLRSARVSAWEAWLAPVAQVWDLAVDAVRAQFERAQLDESWFPGPMPGIRLVHLDGGPATAGADVGIVSFAPGLAFPHHGHGGVERYVVLQGRIFDVSGRIELPGETVEYREDLVHSFTTDPEVETVIALVLRGELQILG